MDGGLLRRVEEALALGATPAFFYAPSGHQYDAATNSCRYTQEEDGTEVVATFRTGLDGSTEVEDVKKIRRTPSKKAGPARAKLIAPTPFESSTSEEEEGSAFPGAARGAATEARQGYKFYRFRVLDAAGEKSIRALRLFSGRAELDLLRPELGAKVWDPTGAWNGSIRDITWAAGGTGKGWTGRALILGFREPVAVDRYSFVAAGVSDGPRSWKLEGSTNGVYWEPVTAAFVRTSA